MASQQQDPRTDAVRVLPLQLLPWWLQLLR